jgi:hypothetical protein
MSELVLPLQVTDIEPEQILIIAAFIWGFAAIATGYPRGRFPAEYPFLFAVIAIITAMIGITEYVTETADVLLTIIAVVLFALTPIALAVRLYQAYPPVEHQRRTHR